VNNRLKNHDSFLNDLISGISTIQEYNDKMLEALRVTFNTKMNTDFIALEMNAYKELDNA